MFHIWINRNIFQTEIRLTETSALAWKNDRQTQRLENPGRPINRAVRQWNGGWTRLREIEWSVCAAEKEMHGLCCLDWDSMSLSHYLQIKRTCYKHYCALGLVDCKEHVPIIPRYVWYQQHGWINSCTIWDSNKKVLRHYNRYILSTNQITRFNHTSSRLWYWLCQLSPNLLAPTVSSSPSISFCTSSIWTLYSIPSVSRRDERVMKSSSETSMSTAWKRWLGSFQKSIFKVVRGKAWETHYRLKCGIKVEI